MTTYRAILFDNDGILTQPTDTEILQTAISEAFEACGIEDPPADHVDSLHDVTIADVQRICRRYDLDPETFWARREEAAFRRQREAIRDERKSAYPDLDVLRAFDVPVGIVSNNQHATIRFIVEYFDLEAAVETYYGREPTPTGVRRKKPNAYYLRQALADIGTEEALYVGDSQKDVVGARRLGIDSAFVRRPHRETLALDPEPTFEVSDLHELKAVLEPDVTTPAAEQ